MAQTPAIILVCPFDLANPVNALISHVGQRFVPAIQDPRIPQYDICVAHYFQGQLIIHHYNPPIEEILQQTLHPQQMQEYHHTCGEQMFDQSNAQVRDLDNYLPEEQHASTQQLQYERNEPICDCDNCKPDEIGYQQTEQVDADFVTPIPEYQRAPSAFQSRFTPIQEIWNDNCTMEEVTKRRSRFIENMYHPISMHIRHDLTFWLISHPLVCIMQSTKGDISVAFQTFNNPIDRYIKIEAGQVKFSKIRRGFAYCMDEACVKSCIAQFHCVNYLRRKNELNKQRAESGTKLTRQFLSGIEEENLTVILKECDSQNLFFQFKTKTTKVIIKIADSVIDFICIEAISANNFKRVHFDGQQLSLRNNKRKAAIDNFGQLHIRG